MKKLLSFLLAFCSICALGQDKVTIASPDRAVRFELRTSNEEVTYNVTYHGRTLIKSSSLGFEFEDGTFEKGVVAKKDSQRRIDEPYSLIVGKVSEARDFCNEAVIELRDKYLDRRVNLVVRVYDDGAAFRFVFPKQDGWNSYVMYDEKTQFNLAGNPKCLFMYLPGYTSSHENTYEFIDYDQIEEKRLIEMPATFDFGNDVYAAITEAAIRDYAGMYLMKENGCLNGKLSPKIGEERIKVVAGLFPHKTPWRVIMIGSRIGALIESTILTSLNEPCAIEDTEWIKPCRMTFTWWNGNVVPDTTFSPGNNFATNKYYIDFVAKNGLDAHSIYGYAETPWYYDDNFNFAVAGKNADVTKPIPCLEMTRISEYAKSKGVGIHLWVNWRPLYDKLEEAFALYESWGVRGLMVDFMDRDDQEMIRIQENILKCAARHHLFIQFHGASKPSGLVRTYPNEFTREGTLNYEVCKWAKTVNADHDISIPFTRMLAGATDYHLGGFRAQTREKFQVQYVNPHVMSTRCHMLAMYVVLENHLTSLCDTPMAYEEQPGFEVLKTVPGTWNETKVPIAKFNEYITLARRNGSEWWIGTINNGTARKLSLPLTFIGDGEYEATIYSDADDVNINANHIKKDVHRVNSSKVIDIILASDGGSLIHLRKI